MTAVGFEPTPFRTGALSQHLRPLGQTVGKNFTLLISIASMTPIMVIQVLARSCAVYLRWLEGVRHIQCAMVVSEDMIFRSLLVNNDPQTTDITTVLAEIAGPCFARLGKI